MQTLDYAFPSGGGERTRFYEAQQLGATQSLTPEGFLICHDVPIARAGVMVYSQYDLPKLVPTKDGVLYIDRTADEVFSPAAISSFEGKPVTIDHPLVDVIPSNWKQYAVGYVTNVRRGEGAMDDKLIADLVITDEAAIRKVRNGKREVSLGYDAEYEQISPGYGKQKAIMGNHVAIVDAGRCGPTCKIGDAKMATNTWLDRARRAFMTRDADDFEKAVADKPADDKPADDKPVPPKGDDKPVPPKGDDDSTGGVHHHITVNVGGANADPAAAAGPSPAVAADPAAAAGGGDAGGDDPISILTDAVIKIASRLDALEQQVNGGGAPAPAAEGDDPAPGPDDAPADPSDPAPGPDDAPATGSDTDSPEEKTTDARRKTRDAKVKTFDAAGLAKAKEEFYETLALAEILVPGIRIPTFDASSGPKGSEEALCTFRRRVVDAALGVDKTREVVNEFYDGKTPIRSMTCDAVKTLFLASSAKVRDQNNNHQRNENPARKGAVLTIADINRRNSEIWKR